jgi:nuclear transport factor 2 (NTF2) superfamily protein
MDHAEPNKFAQSYAEAWCSQNPERVAAFYAEGGSLRVNDGPRAVGRRAIAKVAQGFMRDLPDMKVTLDAVTRDERGTVFHWTLTGTNIGPGGAGKKRVRISGYEEWQIDEAGLIGQSQGHMDSAEYARQLEHGAGGREGMR